MSLSKVSTVLSYRANCYTMTQLCSIETTISQRTLNCCWLHAVLIWLLHQISCMAWWLILCHSELQDTVSTSTSMTLIWPRQREGSLPTNCHWQLRGEWISGQADLWYRFDLQHLSVHVWMLVISGCTVLHKKKCICHAHFRNLENTSQDVK